MFVVVLCTTPVGEAEKIAEPLVEEKLVACVNIVDVKSLFWWKAEIEDEKESLLVMKTRADKVDEIIERVKELHSYEIPEIIALPIISGSQDYLDWMNESVK